MQLSFLLVVEQSFTFMCDHDNFDSVDPSHVKMCKSRAPLADEICGFVIALVLILKNGRSRSKHLCCQWLHAFGL